MNPNELQEIKAELARDQEKRDIERRRGNRQRLFVLGAIFLASTPFLIHFGPTTISPHNKTEFPCISVFIGAALLAIAGIISLLVSTKGAESFPWDI
jgi:hypothetical protein